MWGIRRSINKKFLCQLTQFRAFSSTKVENTNQTQNEPKWMQLFKETQPFLVDLERSLMNENSDLLNTHIKTNYRSFNFSQLILILEKINKLELIQLVKGEINKRIVEQDYEGLQINKDALMKMLNSKRIDWKTELFQEIILIYGQKNFDKLDLSQKMQFFQFLIEIGMKNDQLKEELQIQIQNESLDQTINRMSLKMLLSTLIVCNKLKRDEFFQDLSNVVEDKIFQILSDKNNLHKVLEQYIFVTPERSETLNLMIQLYENQLDPQYYGIYREAQVSIENIVKQQLSALLNNIAFQHRQLLLKLLILQGNKIKKQQEIDLKSFYAKIQVKYQFIHWSFFTFYLKESAATQNTFLKNTINQQDDFVHHQTYEQYFSNKVLYFYEINSHQITLNDTLLDLTNQFKLFHINNLKVIKKYSQFFSIENLQKQLHMVLSQDPTNFQNQSNHHTHITNQKSSETTSSRQDIQQKLKIQIQMLGYEKDQINFSQQNNFYAVDTLALIVRILSIVVQNYSTEQIENLFKDFSELWNTTNFEQFVKKFGMIPHLAESLIQIMPYMNQQIVLINQIQNEMNQIFNKSNENPQQFILDLEVEIQKFQDKINLKKQYYQEYSQQQLYHSDKLFNRVFSIYDRENYYLKLLNGQQIQKIIKHTPLKQIIRDSLDKTTWQMNFVNYPALADFINEKEKIVLFIIDEARMIMGVSNTYDKNTHESMQYFKKLGYKTIPIDIQCYYVKRSDIINKINSMIINS